MCRIEDSIQTYIDETAQNKMAWSLVSEDERPEFLQKYGKILKVFRSKVADGKYFYIYEYMFDYLLDNTRVIKLNRVGASIATDDNKTEVKSINYSIVPETKLNTLMETINNYYFKLI